MFLAVIDIRREGNVLQNLPQQKLELFLLKKNNRRLLFHQFYLELALFYLITACNQITDLTSLYCFFKWVILLQ